eukprot:11220519-Karenia_brevis.AAC.1
MGEDEVFKERVTTATQRIHEQERQRDDPQPTAEPERAAVDAQASSSSSGQARTAGGSAAEKREAPEAETVQADLVGDDVSPPSPISEMEYELDPE